MSRSTKIIIVAVIICAIGLLAGLLLEHYTKSSESGSAAKDFTVQDAKGNDVKLSDYSGKPVVINFATSWCSYCRQEMPDIQKAYEKYGSKVQFMIIDAVGASGETKASFVKYIKSKGYTFPVYYDNDQSALEAYGITTFPHTFFIDKNGNLSDQILGATNYDDLKTQIESML